MRAAFSCVPHVKVQSWTKRFFKILVIGESGLGKTTFIRNLFAAYAQDPNLIVNDASAPTSRDTFIKSPEKLLSEVVVRDEASQTEYFYHVQDTPGFENMEDNMQPVLDYIHANNKKYVDLELDSKRVRPLHHFEDARVDVALYFISPHRMKPVDVQFITALSALVPVVPILAKADSMTSAELETFRQAVRQRLLAASKDADRSVFYKFSPEALREAGAVHEAPPFAVISSNTMDLTVGRFWPVRRYPWGTCEALSSVHSDMAALKKLLFETSYLELKSHTEDRYHLYREQALGSVRQRELKDAEAVDTESGLTRPGKVHTDGLKGMAGLVLNVVGFAALLYAGSSILVGHKRVNRTLVEAKEAVKEHVPDIAGNIVDAAGSVKDTIQEKVPEAFDHVKDAAGNLKERIAPPPPKPKRKFLGIF
jgi:septin 7